MPSSQQTAGQSGTARRTTFTTILELGGKTATGIEVPPQVVEAFGAGKRPPVTVTVNGHSWQSTVAVMGGRFMLGVPAEHRAAAGVNADDTLEVTLELDDAPRAVAVPRDLAEALAAADATAAFDRLAPSHRKEHVRSVEDAKKPETRARRIAKVIDALA
jgi:uncharacterized protein (DUF1800 family)